MRRLTARAAVMGVLAGGFAVGGVAHAQDVGVSLYRPVTPGARGFGVEGAAVLPHLAWAAAADLDYAAHPLRITTLPDGTSYPAISHQLQVTALAALGLGSRAELALAVPALLSQGGTAPPGLSPPPGSGVGDLRLTAKVNLLRPTGAGYVASLALTAAVPPAGSAGVNESGVWFEPRALVGRQWRRWQWDARLGYRLRPRTNLWGTALDDELTFGAAGQVRLRRAVRVIAELEGATAADGNFFKRRRTPVEGRVGARRQFGHWQASVALGAGLVGGYGAPEWRLLGSVGYATVGPDSDHDGIEDVRDDCVDEPEDRDGFADTDGCPDPDNDDDGIADADDRCPDEAEDGDEFEDDDGCPDPDNDDDGLADEDDKCPNEPETANQFEDEDGCPDEAPVVDSDGDGVVDANDKCPKEPEDRDGFEDDDGCPDPDNDKDGVADKDDKCPNDPETINGNKDEDGCPDEGKPQVRIGAKELEVLQPIFFDTNYARVRHRFYNLLGQIAQTLKAHPEIGRCAIEGHTDDTGPERWNQELSLRRARAVVNFLVARGVERERLSPIGQGQKMPWADNQTDEGRARNRRVVFHIEGLSSARARGLGGEGKSGSRASRPAREGGPAREAGSSAGGKSGASASPAAIPQVPMTPAGPAGSPDALKELVKTPLRK